MISLGASRNLQQSNQPYLICFINQYIFELNFIRKEVSFQKKTLLYAYMYPTPKIYKTVSFPKGVTKYTLQWVCSTTALSVRPYIAYTPTLL